MRRFSLACLCALALASMCSIPSADARPPQTPKQFTFDRDTATWQPGSPAQVVATLFANGSRIIDGALILNVSSQSIVDVKLGCALIGTFPGETSPRVFQTMAGTKVFITIAPGQVKAIGPQAWYTKNAVQSADAAGITNIAALVGVVSAGLQDGTRFTFSPNAIVGFTKTEGAEFEDVYSEVTDIAMDAAWSEIASSAQEPVPSEYALPSQLTGTCSDNYGG